LVTHACTLRNLVAHSSAAGQASDGIVLVYLAGSSTGITCTIGTGTSCTDTTHTSAATAGQMVTVGIAEHSGTTSVADVAVAFDCM
jgi:hypothetical protein